MKTIQHIGVFLLLLVFLFGTTGFSVLHHFCNSSNRENATFYPEIFKNSGSSCCEDEFTGYACSGQGNLSVNTMPQHVEEVPCCKSILSFFKLLILSEKVEKLIFTTFALLPLNPVSVICLSSIEQPLLLPVRFQFHSPPLYGKDLVRYLHQMKIPSHPSLA